MDSGFQGVHDMAAGAAGVSATGVVDLAAEEAGRDVDVVDVYNTGDGCIWTDGLHL